MAKKYKLLFANQSEDNKGSYYDLVRETKLYLFLQQPNMPHVYRVDKRSLAVKGIKEGKGGYQWDAPKARSLKKL